MLKAFHRIQRKDAKTQRLTEVISAFASLRLCVEIFHRSGYSAVRRFVTLVEILIVVAILSVVLGVVGVAIGPAVQAERFRVGVETVVHKLRLAQDLMMILHSSAVVRLEETTDGIRVGVVSDGPLSPLLRNATSASVVLEPIKSFRFTPEKGDPVTDSVKLEFLSGGAEVSQGKLELFAEPSQQGDPGAIIELLGYPAPIVEGRNPLKPLSSSSEESIRLYPPEIKQLVDERAGGKTK